jgi:hypothetical protein
MDLRAQLRQMGISVTSEWCQQCTQQMASRVPNFANLPTEDQLQLAFQMFLECDLNTAGAGELLPSLQVGHLHRCLWHPNG